jgi:hypothetical protein
MSLLRNILGLSILYASMLFAGVPAVSCAESAPLHDCCPPQPVMPCRGGDSCSPNATNSRPSCVAGAQCAAAVTAAVPDKIEKHSKRIDPPALIVSFALHAALYSPRFVRGITIPTYYHSHSTLYLSTGRLRL